MFFLRLEDGSKRVDVMARDERLRSRQVVHEMRAYQ